MCECLYLHKNKNLMPVVEMSLQWPCICVRYMQYILFHKWNPSGGEWKWNDGDPFRWMYNIEYRLMEFWISTIPTYHHSHAHLYNAHTFIQICRLGIYIKYFIIFELETVVLVPTKIFYPSFPQNSGTRLLKGFCHSRPRARFHSSHHDQNLLSNKFIHKFSDYPIVYTHIRIQIQIQIQAQTHTHTHHRICLYARYL